jgi:hypothetical protein
LLAGVVILDPTHLMAFSSMLAEMQHLLVSCRCPAYSDDVIFRENMAAEEEASETTGVDGSFCCFRKKEVFAVVCEIAEEYRKHFEGYLVESISTTVSSRRQTHEIIERCSMFGIPATCMFS